MGAHFLHFKGGCTEAFRNNSSGSVFFSVCLGGVSLPAPGSLLAKIIVNLFENKVHEAPADNSCNYSKDEALTRTRSINHSSGSIIPVEHAIRPNQPHIRPRD